MISSHDGLRPPFKRPFGPLARPNLFIKYGMALLTNMKNKPLSAGRGGHKKKIVPDVSLRYWGIDYLIISL